MSCILSNDGAIGPKSNCPTSSLVGIIQLIEHGEIGGEGDLEGMPVSIPSN